MPKPIVITAVAAGIVVIGGGAYLATQKDSPSDSSNNNNTSQSATDSPKLVDPDGVYKVYSDPSITKFPEAGVEFGNGQTLTFEYDGSKTNGDEYATLSYQLFYIQADGKVQPMTGGNLEGKNKGTFTVSDKVYNSSAKGANGFLELAGTYDTSASEGQITGKDVKLGMYPIKFTIAE